VSYASRERCETEKRRQAMDHTARPSPQQEPRWLGNTAPSRLALIAPLSLARWLLVLVIAAGVYFFHGFLVPVLAALVIGFASWPVYRDILRRCGGNRALAATVAILLILAFLVVPLVMAISYTISELGIWFTWAVETNRTGRRRTGSRRCPASASGSTSNGSAISAIRARWASWCRSSAAPISARSTGGCWPPAPACSTCS
jgi:hypothetical protein